MVPCWVILVRKVAGGSRTLRGSGVSRRNIVGGSGCLRGSGVPRLNTVVVFLAALRVLATRLCARPQVRSSGHCLALGPLDL